MKYTKPPLSFKDQAQQLLNRGLVGHQPTMIQRLQVVNYYRLSGYWYPFRQSNPSRNLPPLDDFKPGSLFEHVWERYVFDRQLRLIVMDAVERIEVAVRSQLAYHHAHSHGPFAYAHDRASLPQLDWKDLHDFLRSVGGEICRSKEEFIMHFRDKYGDCHSVPPVWMSTELMTVGSVLTFYRGADARVRQNVATVFGLPDTVFGSWLHMLQVIRNICAHHARLWNRQLGVKPMIPQKQAYPDWHIPIAVANDRVFAVLTICKYCLNRVAPQSRWAERFRALMRKFPGIPRRSMGFPANWEQCPIWTDSHQEDYTI